MHGWILTNGGVALAMLCNILVAGVKCMLKFKQFLMNINVVAFFVWVFRALMPLIGNYIQLFFWSYSMSVLPMGLPHKFSSYLTS